MFANVALKDMLWPVVGTRAQTDFVSWWEPAVLTAIPDV